MRGVCATGLCPGDVPDKDMIDCQECEQDDEDKRLKYRWRGLPLDWIISLGHFVVQKNMPVIEDPSEMAITDERIVEQVHLSRA